MIFTVHCQTTKQRSGVGEGGGGAARGNKSNTFGSSMFQDQLRRDFKNITSSK